MAYIHTAYTTYELLREKDFQKATKPYHQAVDLNSHLKFWLNSIKRIRIKNRKLEK